MIVRSAFGQRRKMLRNSLKYLKGFEEKERIIKDALSESGISPDERPENLPLEAFAALSNTLSSIIS
jgi:16S rRNA A1518/A1519 N6-dimethyltransferase RsmA/KsgA/DIM1 with predicted DNA glycosylase/AP lyase activity